MLKRLHPNMASQVQSFFLLLFIRIPLSLPVFPAIFYPRQSTQKQDRPLILFLYKSRNPIEIIFLGGHTIKGIAPEIHFSISIFLIQPGDASIAEDRLGAG